MPVEAYAKAGPSALEAEEPDLVIYRLRGTLQAHELRTLCDADARWAVGKPYVIVIIDIGDLNGITMAARRAAAQQQIGSQIRGLAMFGGSRHIRVLADLAIRGINLLSSKRVHIRTVDDETAAREWLYAQRSALAAKVKP